VAFLILPSCHIIVLFTAGAGYGLGQGRMDFVQQTAFGSTFGKSLFQDTLLAGTFYKISDFKIVFVFKFFFNHYTGCHNYVPIGARY